MSLNLIDDLMADEEFNELPADPAIPSPMTAEEVMRKVEEESKMAALIRSTNDLGPYIPEEQNPDILIKGRWLERGGSAWWISTAGTGKSIASQQLALLWSVGLPFAGLTPHRPLTTWIFQTEDSTSRCIIDREDIYAELAETYPDINWREVGNQVKFIDVTYAGAGSNFLNWLDELLTYAAAKGIAPDVIQLNPFYGFVGGPISDSAYMTPFLRGSQDVKGLNFILNRHKVGSLIFHHTAKPPSEKEVAAWLDSIYPEYQGAGSSDITNWGRSFITMMKTPGHPRVVTLAAGKNGGEIGWEFVNAKARHHLAYSNGVGITGRGRHAWRELTEEEYEAIVGTQKQEIKDTINQVADAIADQIKSAHKVYTASEARDVSEWKKQFGRDRVRAAIDTIVRHPYTYKITIREVNLTGRGANTKFIGLAEDCDREIARRKEQIRYAEALAAGKSAQEAARASGAKNVPACMSAPTNPNPQPMSVDLSYLNESPTHNSPQTTPQISPTIQPIGDTNEQKKEDDDEGWDDPFPF